MRRMMLINIGVLCTSLLVALVLIEIGLRFALPNFTNYYTWPPRSTTIFEPISEYLPGIEGESRFMTNSYGLRGEEPSDEDTYRIIAIGGSTTECLYLDQSEAWPQRVQDTINQHAGEHIWIGNAGKSGISTRVHVAQMRHIPDQLPSTDAVIVLPGVNDFIDRLAAGDAYVPDMSDVDMNQDVLVRAFSVMPRYDNADLPFYKRTRIWFLLTKLSFYVRTREDIQDRAGEIYVRQRQQRQEAEQLSSLPSLDSALAEYRHRLHLIIDEAKLRSLRIIFATQPSLWRDNLTQEEDALLWFGWASPERWGSDAYYSPAAMAEGMEAYNRALLSVCEDRDVECIDLASAIPKTAEMFYDDVHFTEAGSAEVAAILSAYLLETPRD